MSESAKVAISGIVAVCAMYGLLVWQRVSLAQASTICMTYSENRWDVEQSICVKESRP